MESRVRENQARNGGNQMTYDDWKTESPEDEDERINGPSRRRQARREWLADNADHLVEDRREIDRLDYESQAMTGQLSYPSEDDFHPE
jgi:hypothetical protein